MSCPTWILFKNEVDGTEKRIFVNLGWVNPSYFQLAKFIIDAAKELPDDYEWHKLRIMKVDYGWMSKEKFDEMSQFVRIVETHDNPEFVKNMIKRFTLEKTWIKE